MRGVGEEDRWAVKDLFWQMLLPFFKRKEKWRKFSSRSVCFGNSFLGWGRLRCSMSLGYTKVIWGRILSWLASLSPLPNLLFQSCPLPLLLSPFRRQLLRFAPLLGCKDPTLFLLVSGDHFRGGGHTSNQHLNA